MPAIEVVVAAIMLVALVGYALTGGADFGGGVWDLLAFGPRAERQRERIDQALAPIWEANHVWLILVLVILFTGFPSAFATIMTALHIPVTLLLIGIVLRGAAFAFRSQLSGDRSAARRWGRVFAGASIATPVLLGVIVGAISSGRIGREEEGRVTGGFVDPWLTPFAFAVGGFALALFAYLAAVYLAFETHDPELKEDFRRRALLAAPVAGVLALVVFLLSADGAPQIRADFASRWWSWPLLVLTGLAAVAAVVLLLRRRYALARAAAVAQVSGILGGWGLALYPHLVVPDVMVADAAAPAVTLQLLLGGLVLGAVILFPALWYLYRIFKGEEVFAVVGESGED